MEKADLEQVLREPDIITLHLPCTKETYHIIDSNAINKMKTNAVLINTARGDLVDEEALAEALRTNRIFGAGLDVYAHEPIKESPLFELRNVTFMPHCSANTSEAAKNMGMMAVENAYRAIKGMDNAHIL